MKVSIKEPIQSLKDDWKLNLNDMLCIMTDSGTNMVKAAEQDLVVLNTTFTML